MVKTHAYPALEARQLAGSEVRAVHQSTDPAVTDVLARHGSYVDARAALAALADYGFPKPPQLRPPDVTIAAAIIDAVKAGKPVPDDIADRVDDVTASAARHQAHVNGINHAQQQLVQELDAELRRHTTELHESMTAALCGLVDDADRLFANGPRPRNADDAIDKRVVEDYIAGTRLAERYAALRALQYDTQRALNAGPDHLDGTLPSLVAYFVANPLDVVPDPATAEQATRGPWPADWRDAEALWWFVDHAGAKPWAPTHDQVQRVLKALVLARQPRRDPAEARRIEQQRLASRTSGELEMPA